ncbi:MAG: TerC family protein [Bacillota bacterium]
MGSDIYLAIVQIIIINLVLSGDNAVVIALACRNLPPKQQNLGILWGTLGAVVLRILLTAIAAVLLTMSYIQFFGGLLLLYIGIKLLKPEDEGENIEAGDSLIAAVKTIIFADLVMSLDNVLAVAAAAGGNLYLLIFGIALSIPIVVFCSKLMITLMDRWPIIIYIGAGVIGHVAGEMLVSDKSPIIQNFVHSFPVVHTVMPWLMVAVVLGVGYWMNKKAAKHKKIDDEGVSVGG